MPVAVDKPYPTTDGLCPDVYSLRIISPAYASPQSELNTILQYVYHAFFFEKEGHKEIADLLTGISVSEMRHFNLLGSAILALGATPVFAQYPMTGFNFYSAKYVTYSSSLRHMLEDDIRGERYAIASYTKMLKCLVNGRVRSIISRIVEDEKIHLEKLERILCEFKG